MKNSDFPEHRFRDGLKETKKIKSNMKGFLEEYTKMNLPWIFESFKVLVTNLTDHSVSPLIKMNTVFAIKCIIDRCEYVPITLVEVYVLPLIVKIGGFDPHETSDKRGHDYFLRNGYAGVQGENIESYGFNTVKLCFEILQVVSKIKPRALYYNEETKDQSNFAREYKEVLKNMKEPPQSLAFFKQNPENLRKLFLQNLENFGENETDAYAQYMETVFFEQIKQNFHNTHLLDVREIYKTGDFYICEDGLLLINQLVQKGKTTRNVTTGIEFINQMVKAGVFQVKVWAHNNEIIKLLVEAIDRISGENKRLSRGEEFMADKKGTGEEKKNLYTLFLGSLELWAHSYLRTGLLSSSKSESNIRKYYEYLRNVQGYEFPDNILLKKELKECQENYLKHKDRNALAQAEIEESNELKPQSSNQIISKVEKGGNSPPKNSSNQKLPSDSKVQKKEEPRKSEISIKEENKKSESKIASEKQFSVKKMESNHVTPQAPSDDLSERSLKTAETFINRLNKVEMILANIKNSEKNLPKNMEYLMSQKKMLEKNLETVDLNDDELEDIMGKYFELAEIIEQLEPVYAKYKKNQINFDKFCREAKTPQIKQNSSLNQKMEESRKQESASLKKIEESRKTIKDEASIPVKAQSKHSIESQSKVKDQSKQEAKVQSKQEFRNESKQQIKNESRKSIVKESKHQIKVEIKNESSQKISNEQKPSEKNLGQEISKKKVELEEKNEFKEINEEKLISRDDHSISKDECLSENRNLLPIEHQREQQKVEFQNSRVSSSRVSHRIVESQVIDHNPSIHLAVLKEEEVAFEEDHAIKVKSVRRFNEFPSKKRFEQQKQEPQIGLITNQKGKKSMMEELSSKKSLYDEIQSPAKKKEEELDDGDDGNQEIPRYIEDDQCIEGPSLNPLDNSFHEDDGKDFFKKKPRASFKDVLNSSDFIVTGTKKENLYWLKAEAESIMKPVNNLNKKTRVQSVISVPELLDEKNKKYESEIKEVEENKNRKIKELQNQLKRVENEKLSAFEQLKAKEREIIEFRESENGGSRLKVEQVNYIEDQNYVMKKLSSGNPNLSFSHSHRKKDFEKASTYENLTKSYKMINTKAYAEIFKKFEKEKEKKMHLKNKELLHKDSSLEIGCMGHREGNSYRITCYVTPKYDMKILKIGIESDDNLSIKHEVSEEKTILKNEQQKLHFFISVEKVPFKIPYLYIHYQMFEEEKRIIVFLPCAFHKFFKIEQMDENFLNDLFEKKSSAVQRGEEIPYSKRALKNLDSLLDYLPHIAKLNGGNTDKLGEFCYGGNAIYKKTSLPIKICIKPNQFLYIRAINESKSAEDQQILDFYVATLNHFLMKDISWE